MQDETRLTFAHQVAGFQGDSYLRGFGGFQEMDDEIIVYHTVIAQGGDVGKDGLRHAEQLHGLVYHMCSQIVSHASAGFACFFPGALLDEIAETGEGRFELDQASEQVFSEYFLNGQEIAVPTAVLINTQC